jgi:hypothetical protein
MFRDDLQLDGWAPFLVSSASSPYRSRPMKRFSIWAALTCLLFSTLSLSAADLTRIDRMIAREPAYKSKPRYCLLVFGPEAKTRIWLVQGGDTLYVDRNGNGDLSEPGKKVAAVKGTDIRSEEGEFSFAVGAIREGKRTHRNLMVAVQKLDRLAGSSEQVKAFLAKNAQGRGYFVKVEVEMPGMKGEGAEGRVPQAVYFFDSRGLLQFADRPQDAPVIHFGGPLQITFCGEQRLTAGRQTELVLGVGTPGLGPGTTAFIAYDGVIPDAAYPTVEIRYPPAKSGAAPVKERYELKERC